jgi:hypothetical protein
MKLLDILTEIRINSENGYKYNLSKIRNDYSATFTTENGYEYEYQGEVIDYNNDVIGYEGLDVSFSVENMPNLQQNLEKTEIKVNHKIVFDEQFYSYLLIGVSLIFLVEILRRLLLRDVA